MSSVDEGMRKWEEKTPRAAPKWKQNTNVAAWTDGLRRAGASPGPISTQNYQSGIANASEQTFLAGVQGKGQKWKENFLRGISR
jgi:hypothetical protein